MTTQMNGLSLDLIQPGWSPNKDHASHMQYHNVPAAVDFEDVILNM